MIAVDANLLVYAHRPEALEHAAALASLRRLAEGRAPWAIPWSAIHEFLCVVTNSRLFREPTPLEIALESVQRVLESPSVVMLSEPRGYWAILGPLALRGAATGPLIFDARIAATCVAHGVRELWTADRDFGRFPALRVHNPLVAGG